MSYQAPAATTRRVAIPQSVLRAAAAVFICTTALTLYGAHGRYEIPIVMTGIVLSMIGIYGFLLPRKLSHPSPGGTAFILSVIAVVLLLPTFWSGQSLILGVAGIMLGYVGRKGQSGARRSVVAVALGLLASVGYLTIYLLDALLPPGTA